MGGGGRRIERILDCRFRAAAARAGPRWESIELKAPAHRLTVIILERL